MNSEKEDESSPLVALIFIGLCALLYAYLLITNW
jgi:hypothetical protein